MLPKFLMVLFAVVAAFRVEDNLIEWSAERKLTWSDFKGTPDPTSTNAALTNSSITVQFGYNNKGLTHSIKCRFNKDLSWGRIKNDYILHHEQGHFDIAEIHARILHKDLLGYTFNNKTVSTDINKIYESVMKQHVATQQQYDGDTNHSIDTAQQRQWNQKIASALQEYKQFADYK